MGHSGAFRGAERGERGAEGVSRPSVRVSPPLALQRSLVRPPPHSPGHSVAGWRLDARTPTEPPGFRGFAGEAKGLAPSLRAAYAARMTPSPPPAEAGIPPPSPPPDPDTIVGRIAAARALRRVSEKGLARRSGLAWGALWYVLNKGGEGLGRSVATLRALARALDVDPAWLAFGEPYPAPSVTAGEVLPAAPVEGLAAPPAPAPAAEQLSAEVLPVAEAAPLDPPEPGESTDPRAPPSVTAAEADTATELGPTVEAVEAVPAGDEWEALAPAVRAALAAGWSQRRIASVTQVSQGALSGALAGRTRLGPVTCARLAAWVQTLPAMASGGAP